MERQGKSILVVDDQVGIRRLLYELFNSSGYNTHVAANGVEAVEKVKKESPNVVILDMKLPGMNGIEILQKLKDVSPQTKVVMMTAYGEKDTIQQALDLGAVCHFFKPFDVIELKQKISEILEAYIAN
ncbi:MAG: two-component system, response regulator, stage 0 sporulation protein [Thermosediminibacterales bacterium]|nr:two-component system, response regulator, stage 0 sporulation protein [Thermosediminibacterales bacterium]